MFDLAALKGCVARHGRVARIVIADHAGSSPRESGTAMLVWADGSLGTIGGGALEWEAMSRARRLLPNGGHQIDRVALGPNIGQCCGGAVTLLTEIYSAKDLAPLHDRAVVARNINGAEQMPLAVHRILARARASGEMPSACLLQGWMIEPCAKPARQIWIWGAGHVGRALVDTLSPLNELEITWVDTDRARFPDVIPPAVQPLWAAHPQDLTPHCPPKAEHLILTFSHSLDLELCHRLLLRGDFDFLGLIGSATKRARFLSRLSALGHSSATIARLTCPIGDVTLGKHPQAIAIGVAVDLLSKKPVATESADDQRDRRTPRTRGIDQSLSGGGGE